MAVLLPPRHKHKSRGNDSMNDKPNIVETYKFGNTTVHIADNHVRNDPVEIQKILDEHNRIGLSIIDGLASKGIGEGELWIESVRSE